MYDCCRGNDQDVKVKSRGNKSGLTSNLSDQFRWFACSSGLKAFEEEGGYFTNEIYCFFQACLTHKLYVDLQGDAAIAIKKIAFLTYVLFEVNAKSYQCV